MDDIKITLEDAIYLYEHEEFDDAVILFEEAYSSLEDFNTELVIDNLKYIINCYIQMDDLDKAFNWVKKLLIKSAIIYGEDSENTLEILNIYSNMYSDLYLYGSVDEDDLDLDVISEIINQNIVKANQYISKKDYDESNDIFNLLNSICNNMDFQDFAYHLQVLIAKNYSFKEEYDSALEYALPSYQYYHDLGENTIDIVDVCNVLGSIYVKKKETELAIEYLEEGYVNAIELEDCPSSLISALLANLSVNYYALNQYGKTIEAMEKYYSLKHTLGDHRGVYDDTLDYIYKESLKYVNNKYTQVNDDYNEKYDQYIKKGDYKNALDLSIQKYNNSKEERGELDHGVLGYLVNIGSCYRFLGDLTKAYNITKEAYNSLKEYYTLEDKNTLAALNNLALINFTLGRYQEALDQFQLCYDIRIKEYDELDPLVNSLLANIGNCYSALGEIYKATQTKIACYENSIKIFGDNSEETLTVLNDLITDYITAFDQSSNFTYVSDDEMDDDLIQVIEDCYYTCKETLGDQHLLTLSSLNNLGNLHVLKGNIQKGINALTKSLDLKEKYIGKYHISTLQTLCNLASVYYQYHINDTEALQRYDDYFNRTDQMLDMAESLDLLSLRNYLNQFKNAYRVFIDLVFGSTVFIQYLNTLAKYKNIIYDIDLFQNRDSYKTITAHINQFSIEEVQSRLNESDCIVDIYKGNQEYAIIVDQNEITWSTLKNLDADSMKNYKRIFICSDGNESYDSKFANSNLIYISSMKSLLNVPSKVSTNKPILFANVAYDGKYPQLTGSRIQANILKDYFNDLTVYEQYDFDYGHISNIKDPYILHISTHGNFEEGDYANPLDQASLAISQGETISAREMYDCITLNGTHLVYLDTCVSGVGEAITSEGMYGFRRVLELKGAQYIISTLNTVDDRDATIFSIIFYRMLGKYKDIEEAFFKTKEYLKSKDAIQEFVNYHNYYRQYIKQIDPYEVRETNDLIELSQKYNYFGYIRDDYFIEETWNDYILQRNIGLPVKEYKKEVVNNIKEEKSLSFEEKVHQEAINRLAVLINEAGLNPKVLSYYKENRLYYSYLTAGGKIGSIDKITYDPRYEKAVHEAENNYKMHVYHVIEHQNQLVMLYVSSHEEDWVTEQIEKMNYQGYSLFSTEAYVYDLDSHYDEFGEVWLSCYQGALVRVA